MKLTEWFGSEQKPEIVGVYQTDAVNRARITVYQHWDGKQWGSWAGWPAQAQADAMNRSIHQLAIWRGLAEYPSKA